MDRASREFALESEWLGYILGCLRQYFKRITRDKQSIDQKLSESLKSYDPNNIEEFSAAMLNATLQKSLDRKIKNSRKSMAKPYFARVDFRAGDEEENPSAYYIGKMPLIRDGDGVPLIIDWRAPVSNLYYEGRIGAATYDCPDGRIEGEISLKRQYIIENGELNDFFDIDVTASDEFLQLALGSSKDKRLKDIVSTIQEEQNRVIRADMHKPVIVQGAAGSGKTTIALHRVAYLLYNYSAVLPPESVMIIAPNRLFLSYISEVLPDLGVENVTQTTIEDFAQSFVDARIEFKPAFEKLAFLMKHPEHYNSVTAVSKFKSSLIYKRAIDRFINSLAESMIPERDFELCGCVLYERAELKRLLCREYAYLPVSRRAAEVKKYMANALAKRKPEILAAITARYDGELAAIKAETPRDTEERRGAIIRLLDRRDAELNSAAKQAESAVRDYFTGAGFLPAAEYYYNFINDEALFAKCLEKYLPPAESAAIRSFSARNITRESFEAEDAAPIMYIHYLVYGAGDFNIRHIVIDEAQDMGLFQLFVLKTLMNSNSFSILGDLCQGIYSFKGISDWDDAAAKIFGRNARFISLEQSYRTTVEIMDFANKTAAKLAIPGVPLAKPVIRHGPGVRTLAFGKREEALAGLSALADEYAAKGYNSVAVITKTAAEAAEIHRGLGRADLSLITGADDDYAGGKTVVPAFLAKGLEFDGVIIADASAYGSSEFDLKLLYIAMTRALHELTVCSVGEPAL